jgi:hypothetical protein
LAPAYIVDLIYGNDDQFGAYRHFVHTMLNFIGYSLKIRTPAFNLVSFGGDLCGGTFYQPCDILSLVISSRILRLPFSCSPIAVRMEAF